MEGGPKYQDIKLIRSGVANVYFKVQYVSKIQSCVIQRYDKIGIIPKSTYMYSLPYIEWPTSIQYSSKCLSIAVAPTMHSRDIVFAFAYCGGVAIFKYGDESPELEFMDRIQIDAPDCGSIEQIEIIPSGRDAFMMYEYHSGGAGIIRKIEIDYFKITGAEECKKCSNSMLPRRLVPDLLTMRAGEYSDSNYAYEQPPRLFDRCAYEPDRDEYTYCVHDVYVHDDSNIHYIMDNQIQFYTCNK